MANNSHYCLATTAIKDFWDMDSKLLYLGPWCLANEGGAFDIDNALIVPSPWRPAYRVKEAAVYCSTIYRIVLPQISSRLNALHDVSHPVEYWNVLLGYWLIHFIQALYDKYIRIENTLNHYQNCFTYILPLEKCKPISYGYCDLQLGINAKSRSDIYTLKLISIVAYELCPEKTVVKDYMVEDRIDKTRLGWKRRCFNYIKAPIESSFRGKIILSNMHNVGLKDLLKLKIKIGFNKLDFRECMKYYPQIEQI